MTFKVGDKVVCVDDAQGVYLTFGKQYTVAVGK